MRVMSAGVLTVGTQPRIEGSDDGIAANSRRRRHIQDAPDLRASAPDTTAAAQFSTIAGRCPEGCRDLSGGIPGPIGRIGLGLSGGSRHEQKCQARGPKESRGRRAAVAAVA